MIFTGGIVMQHIVTIASLLVFAWVNYRLGYNAGYEKGANAVLDEWRAWINDLGGTEKNEPK